MKAFVTFCKKEWLEHWRTHKIIILLAVFVLIGIVNPLIAKLMPDLLNGTDLGGITLTLPEPTALDAWTQFFSNIGQMGLLAMVIVFCGVMSNEFSKGTLVNILTKGMKRHTVVFSKYLVAAVIWTMCYLVCLGVTYAYTAYFWESITLSHAFLAFVGPLVYGFFLVALMILGGILFKTFSGSLLFTGGAAVVLTLLNLSPKLHRWNPVSLANTFDLLNGHQMPGDFMPALILCLAATGCLMTVSVLAFNRKQI